MPVKVTKNGTDYYLVPAPLVNYQKRFVRLGNGQLISNGYTISLNGNILPNKGNPVAVANSGSFSTDSWTSSISPDDDPVQNNFENDVLSATIAKQQKIQELFESGTAINISIFGYGQSSGIDFFANVESVDFPEDGRWALPSRYTISLLANKIEGQPEDFNYYVGSVDESWSIKESDQVKLDFRSTLNNAYKVYEVNHTLNAVGLPVYNSSGGYLDNVAPWQQASGYVNNTLGLGNSFRPSGLIHPLISSGYSIANRKIDETIDKLAGSYSITENYIAYRTGISVYPAIEEINVSVNVGEDGLTAVSIEGTINGLDTNQNTIISNSINKYTNASGYYEDIKTLLYNRVLNITGLSWLHPRSLTSSISRNINNGVISYSNSYNDRPPNLISGSISENISVQNTFPGQNFSSQSVIGRNEAILQYLNSRTNYTRTLNIDINMSRISNNWGTGITTGYWSSATASDVRNWFISQCPSVTQSAAFTTIYEALNPANESGVIPSKVFYSEPKEDWNPGTGKYSYNIQWTYNKE